MKLNDIVINDIAGIISARKSKNEIFRMENRRWHGIVIVSSGKYVYSQGGREYISDKEHVVFLPANSTYSLKCLEPGLCHVINFGCNRTDTELETFYILSGSDMIAAVQRMMQPSLNSTENRLYMLSVLYRIFSRLSVDEMTEKYDAKLSGIQNSINYMKSHFSNPDICLDSISAPSNISTIYFRKIFTKIYGMPPMKYINILRINKAKQLLCENEIIVKEIAFACGYSSIYSFSNSFKKHTGTPPTQYIKRFTEI